MSVNVLPGVQKVQERAFYPKGRPGIHSSFPTCCPVCQQENADSRSHPDPFPFCWSLKAFPAQPSSPHTHKPLFQAADPEAEHPFMSAALNDAHFFLTLPPLLPPPVQFLDKSNQSLSQFPWKVAFCAFLPLDKNFLGHHPERIAGSTSSSHSQPGAQLPVLGTAFSSAQDVPLLLPAQHLASVQPWHGSSQQ